MRKFFKTCVWNIPVHKNDFIKVLYRWLFVATIWNVYHDQKGSIDYETASKHLVERICELGVPCKGSVEYGCVHGCYSVHVIVYKSEYRCRACKFKGNLKIFEAFLIWLLQDQVLHASMLWQNIRYVTYVTPYIIITRDSEVIMFSPCVFVCVCLSMFVTMFVRTI